MFTPAMGLMGSYFSTRRAFAIGVATSGNSIGVSTDPPAIFYRYSKLPISWLLSLDILNFNACADG